MARSTTFLLPRFFDYVNGLMEINDAKSLKKYQSLSARMTSLSVKPIDLCPQTFWLVTPLRVRSWHQGLIRCGSNCEPWITFAKRYRQQQVFVINWEAWIRWLILVRIASSQKCWIQYSNQKLLQLSKV